jgi:hypothetical protein
VYKQVSAIFPYFDLFKIRLFFSSWGSRVKTNIRSETRAGRAPNSQDFERKPTMSKYASFTVPGITEESGHHVADVL